MGSQYPVQPFFAEADAESERASEKFPGQEESVSPTGWLAILVEEVGEVARELIEYELGNILPEGLRARVHAELVQVAAMAHRMDIAVYRQMQALLDVSLPERNE